MATKYIVNNLTGQTISGQQLQPYKVYTALLTQSGSGTEDTINSGTTVVGVTYTINQESTGMDFTNIGAPNNVVGTSFVATGTVPNSWGQGATYTLAYNAGAPTVKVLENTIGNIYFTYQATGQYSVDTYPDTLFTIGKTTGFIASVGDDAAAASYGFLRPVGSDRFYILTNDVEFNNINGFLINTPIEIRVYN